MILWRTQMHENDAADGTDRKIVPKGDVSCSPGLLSAAAESYPGYEFALTEAITPTGLRPAKSIFEAVQNLTAETGAALSRS